MPSEPILRFVAISGLVVLSISLGLLVWMSAYRFSVTRRLGREAKLIAVWESVFSGIAAGGSVAFPRLVDNEREPILLIWLSRVEGSRDHARQRLIRAGRELQFEKTARGLIRQPAIASRLLGINVLGRLKDHGSWIDLVTLVLNPSPMVSLSAARALLHIDSVGGTGILVGALAQRKDWPVRTVATALTEADSASLSEHLSRLIRSGSPKNLPRFIPLLGLLPPEAMWPVLQPLLV
jgi:hypothetical protein